MNRLKLWWYTKINTKNTIFFPNIPLGKADDARYQFDNEKVYLYIYLNDTIALKEKSVLNLDLELVNHPATLAAMGRRDLISYKNGQISHGNLGELFEYNNNDYLVMWDKDFVVKVYKML